MQGFPINIANAKTHIHDSSPAVSNGVPYQDNAKPPHRPLHERLIVS